MFAPTVQISNYWPNPLRHKITASDVMGHIPREISRFCNFFLNYGGALERRVRDNRYRRLSIPQYGLEIPIALIVKNRYVPLLTNQRVALLFCVWL